MSWREQDRPHRRGETSGGAPTRRTDRLRRSVDTAARQGPDEQSEHEETHRRHTRRAARRSSARRVLGQALGRLSTRRAALIVLVVCGLALSIAVPLHTYVSQRDDLRDQLQQQQVLRTQEAQLEQREQQLSDPAQIEAEARTRLHYVLPGQTPYVVQLPTTVPTPATKPDAGQPGAGTSWYQALWNSVVGSNG